MESGYSGLDIMFDNFAIHKDAAVIVGTARDERIHTSLSFPPTHGFTLVRTLACFLILSLRGNADQLHRSTGTSPRHSLMRSATTFRFTIFQSISSP